MGRSVVGNIAWISTTRSTITVLTVTSLVSGTTMGRSVVGNTAWISTTRNTITVLTVTSLLFQIQQWAGVWWETLHGSQLQGALSLY